MRDLFNTNPFGRYDMGRFAAPAFARPVKMGCELHDGYAVEDHEEETDPVTLACKKCAKKHRASGRLAGARMGDDLLDAAKGVFDSLMGTFADLIKEVPPEAAGVYRNRLKICQDMVGANANTGTYVAAASCLRDLYRDIQAGAGVTPTPLIQRAQQPSTFPIVPVAIASVAALGLIYVFTTMKKKPGKK